MATGVRKCKVCGKEYPYCKTARRADIFRWQDVACSPEHGAIYFAEVEAARNPNPVAAEPQEQAVEAAAEAAKPVAKKQEAIAAGKKTATKSSKAKKD